MDEAGTKGPYEAPELKALGNLSDLTRENFQSTNGDFSNFAGVEVPSEGTTS